MALNDASAAATAAAIKTAMESEDPDDILALWTAIVKEIQDNLKNNGSAGGDPIV